MAKAPLDLTTGPIGRNLFLFALPILAVLRETVVYLRQHLVLEPWGPADAVVLDQAAHDSHGRALDDEREREHVG